MLSKQCPQPPASVCSKQQIKKSQQVEESTAKDCKILKRTPWNLTNNCIFALIVNYDNNNNW